jgi:hypothetical protein
MKTSHTVVLSMLAGAVLGAISVGALYAQAKAPGAYLVVGYTDIDDNTAYKANVSDKTPPLLAKYGGRVIVATSRVLRRN